MSLAYNQYCNPAMLAQLCHPWSTQKNKAMNNSVNAYATKGKTYSLTTSLDTRVAIAAATQIPWLPSVMDTNLLILSYSIRWKPSHPPEVKGRSENKEEQNAM